MVLPGIAKRVLATPAFDCPVTEFEVDRRKIVVEHPIRELGVYDIDVKLHPEVATKVKIWVVGRDGEGPPAGKPSASDEKAGKKTPKADKKK